MSIITRINTPDVWMQAFPKPDHKMNKYDRGHAVILGAEELIGATRLSACAALRIGAGLVTVLANISALAYRISLPPDIMIKDDNIENLKHVSVILGGPGGLCERYKNMLQQDPDYIPRVFDADAISEDIQGCKLDLHTVLTPHDGEFTRVFDGFKGKRTAQTLKAAQDANCVVVRKGPETIIAHPDGRVVVNDAPNYYLAKAGSGDVLAGFITGYIAQNMPIFEAACAAVWTHSEAGRRLGPGLIASDLELTVPEIMRDILNV